jgi:uncharacterized protein YerC
MGKTIRTEAVDHFFDAVMTLENKRSVIVFLKMYVRLTKSYHFLRDMKLPRC